MGEELEHKQDIAEIRKLSTESMFHEPVDLDLLNTREILTLMNEQDALVAERVRSVIPVIARAVEEIAPRLAQGGRLIYVGAGSSGRLGVLDAAECPPTFGVAYDTVVGVIAGGDHAIRFAVENAEDNARQAASDLGELGLSELDSVVGISASGRTPYVMGALRYARESHALTVAVSNNLGSRIRMMSDIVIEVDTGPEVLSGSTRLKAGTAQKLVLNMISTAIMVKNGKVFKNFMVDMKQTNLKLAERGKRIVELACQITLDEAGALYEATEGNIKEAIVMGLAGVSAPVAHKLLMQAEGYVRTAVAGHGQK